MNISSRLEKLKEKLIAFRNRSIIINFLLSVAPLLLSIVAIIIVVIRPSTSNTILALTWSAIGSAVTATVNYIFNIYSKRKENKMSAENSARYIMFILTQQYSSLMDIKKFLDNFILNKLENNQTQEDESKLQKYPASGSFLKIEQPTIEKILAYRKFYKYPDYAEALQSLVLAEESYRKCFRLIDSYNQSLSAAFLKPEESLNWQEAIQHLENITAEHEHACIFNEIARNNFVQYCERIFRRFDIHNTTIANSDLPPSTPA